MSLNDFNDETKKYLEKAIEIYASIKDRNIYTFIDNEKYFFSDNDKCELSLFISALFSENNLSINRILNKVEEIKLNDLLNFIHTKKSKINKLDENEYQVLFNDIFKKYIEDNLNCNIHDARSISPEMIVNSLRESNILDVFAKKYGIVKHSFKECMLFEIINLSEEEQVSFMDNIKNKMINNIKPKNIITSNGVEIPFQIWEIMDNIKRKFIGQEQVVENLFYTIINNQIIMTMSNLPDDQRSIVFLDGPSGTGKTAIIKEITEQLDYPYTHTSITNYSTAGYVGNDITDLLVDLYKKSNGNLEEAEKGIIVLDEFDKLNSNGLEMKKAIQQELLNFLGGGTYIINISKNKGRSVEIEFDTSKLTFICLGALTNLRNDKTKNKKNIGFINENESNLKSDYTITPEDLIKFGLEKELVGRFNTYIHTNDYSKDDLENILRYSNISPLKGLIIWAKNFGTDIKINDNVYSTIAELAYNMNTGARSLITIIHSIRQSLFKYVLRANVQVIELDKESIESIYKNITTRSIRG